MRRHGCALASLVWLLAASPALAAPSASGTLTRGSGAALHADLVNNGDAALPYMRLFLPAGTSASGISFSGDGGITTSNSACSFEPSNTAIACQFFNSGNWAAGGHVMIDFTTSPQLGDDPGVTLKVSADGTTDYGPFAIAGPSAPAQQKAKCSKNAQMDRPCADLALQIAQLQPVYPLGAYVSYELQVSNNGDDGATSPAVHAFYSLDGERKFGGLVGPPGPPQFGGVPSTFGGNLLGPGATPAFGSPYTEYTTPQTATSGFMAGGGNYRTVGTPGEWALAADVSSSTPDPVGSNNSASATFEVVPYGDSKLTFRHEIARGKPGRIGVSTSPCASGGGACAPAQDATCQGITACADKPGVECLNSCTDPAPCSSAGECTNTPCTGATCADPCSAGSCDATKPCTADRCGGGRRASARLVRALPAAKTKVVRVEIAVRRTVKKGRCGWLAAGGGRFASGACDKPRWLRVRGGTFSLTRGLPAGRYTLFSRATNGAGFSETTWSKADGNLVAFRVR